MALQKITEVSLDTTVTSDDNPTFYVEKNGTFKRITQEKLKELTLEDVGDLSDLDTEDKSSIVNAINEIDGETSNLKSHLEAVGLSVVDGAINITYEEG